MRVKRQLPTVLSPKQTVRFRPTPDGGYDPIQRPRRVKADGNLPSVTRVSIHYRSLPKCSFETAPDPTPAKSLTQIGFQKAYYIVTVQSFGEKGPTENIQ